MRPLNFHCKAAIEVAVEVALPSHNSLPSPLTLSVARIPRWTLPLQLLSYLCRANLLRHLLVLKAI